MGETMPDVHSRPDGHPRICDIGDYYRSAVEFFHRSIISFQRKIAPPQGQCLFAEANGESNGSGLRSAMCEIMKFYCHSLRVEEERTRDGIGFAWFSLG